LQIELQKVSKRYRFEWIFKGLNYTFQSNESYAIIGHNGSGKSTLLQLLSGYLSPSSGKVLFTKNDIKIDINEVYKDISFCSPYIELIEELSLEESILFHQRFKPLQQGFSTTEVLDLLNLPKSARHKPVQFFSSGMKQRLKLALAFLSDTSVLLLDEPTITLDSAGVAWYRTLLTDFAFGKRTVIIASNVSNDYDGCNNLIDILQYKTPAANK
jgi:ABC-type multidrug transport system ATPase subunit